jgi:hypothetical protein
VMANPFPPFRAPDPNSGDPGDPGFRPWWRFTEAARALAATVLGKGELVVSDAGKVYAPDGSKAVKDLSPLMDAASVAAAYLTQDAGMAKAGNLSDLASAAAARTNLGLGSAATHPASDFDSAGAAAAVSKSSLGLGNVDNTADADKPVSTAQAAIITALTGRFRARNLIQAKYYTATNFVITAAAPTQSRLRVFPFFLDEPATFDRIGTEVTTAAASSALRWVIYADGSGYPAARLLDTGATGDSTTTGFKEATISWTAAAGKYWLGCVPQGGNPGLRTHSSVASAGIGLSSAEIVSLGGAAVGLFLDGVTATPPDPFTAAAPAASAAPAVWLRRA